MPTPGVLYVTMSPKDSLPSTQFHDWYNNEHGPLRLRFPWVQNGFRYRATDAPAEGFSPAWPEWLAWYDLDDMAELTKEPYLRLRGPPVQSERERDTMKQITISRKVYDFVHGQQRPGFVPLEERAAHGLGHEEEGSVLVVVGSTLKNGGPGSAAEKDFGAWYDDEHIPLLSKIPGWQRTRRFRTSTIDGTAATIEYVAIHEYDRVNGLGGPEHKVAMDTPWRTRVLENHIDGKWRRVYKLSYIFGPAPRDLAALSGPAARSLPWHSTDNVTRTFPAPDPAIESIVTTADGVELPYRLEGNAGPDSDTAPTLLFINSVLTTHAIWDDVVAGLKAAHPEYRILRYNSRGSAHVAAPAPITFDLLAADAIALLDALRIRRVAAVIGVSMGGATALDTALLYPERVGRFVACDFNSFSVSGQVWEERIVLAEGDAQAAPAAVPAGAVPIKGDRGVGEVLAEATVRRWFAPAAYDGGVVERRVEGVKRMVRDNSLQGFKKVIRALYEYDLRERMRSTQVPGVFVVGELDGGGALKGVVKTMAEGTGKEGRRLEVVEGAGHLPMVEKPGEVVKIILGVLKE